MLHHHSLTSTRATKYFEKSGKYNTGADVSSRFTCAEGFVVLVSPGFIVFLETLACSDFLTGKINHGFDDCCEIREDFAYETNPVF